MRNALLIVAAIALSLPAQVTPITPYRSGQIPRQNDLVLHQQVNDDGSTDTWIGYEQSQSYNTVLCTIVSHRLDTAYGARTVVLDDIGLNGRWDTYYCYLVK